MERILCIWQRAAACGNERPELCVERAVQLLRSAKGAVLSWLKLRDKQAYKCLENDGGNGV